MKITGILSLLLLSAQLAFAGFGEVNGRVTEASTGKPIPGAYVSLQVEGTIIKQTVTDLDGYYTIKPIETGSYTLKVNSTTFAEQKLDIKVSDGQTKILDFALGANVLETFEVVYYEGLIESGHPMTTNTLTSQQIEGAPLAPLDVIATGPGAFQEDYGSPIQFRGSRPDATLYIIDGIKIIGEPVAIRNSIDDMVIYSGGIPAKYGDATGGIVVITTKSYKKLR